MKHLLTLWAALSMFCAGNPVVRTPKLDRLAGDGFRFTQNCVPLIVREPRMAAAKRGGTSDAFTLNVDLAPTNVDAAGLKAPGTMQGHNMAPLYLATEKPAWRTEFFYEHAIIGNVNKIPASEALVRKDWKYFYWPDFKLEQLFQLAADPFEENDLASDPAQATRLAEMRARFAELKSAAQ